MVTLQFFMRELNEKDKKDEKFVFILTDISIEKMVKSEISYHQFVDFFVFFLNRKYIALYFIEKIL